MPQPKYRPKRAETGPMRFGDDWTGIFIRGDTASWFATALANALASGKVEGFESIPLRELVDLLKLADDSRERERRGIQLVMEFEECRISED